MKNFNKKIFAVFLVLAVLIVPTTPVHASQGVLNIVVNNIPLLGSLKLPVPYKFYINETKSAQETLPEQNVKSNSQFGNPDITRHAVVNAPAEGGKFDFDATFYMKQSSQLPIIGGTIYSKLLKPSDQQINDMPQTKAAGVDSYVDLIARIDDRITVAEQISAYMNSHTWRPIYVFDGDYNLLADVKNSYTVGQENKSFTFPSKGKHTFIVRTVPINANFSNEQLDAPMKFGFDVQGNNNFTISPEVANKLAADRRAMTEKEITKEEQILKKNEKLSAEDVAFLKRFNLYTDGNIAGQVKGRVSAYGMTREAVAVIDDKIVPAGVAVTYENPKLNFIRNHDENDKTKVGSTVYVEYNKTANGDKLPYNIPANPEREGYIFKGWATSRAATAADFNPNKNVVSDGKYYAIWKEKVTVNFDSAGGSPVESVEIGKGEAVAAPAEPTREGYTFAGWTKDGANFNFSTSLEANTTLVAKWEQTLQPKPVTHVFRSRYANIQELPESVKALVPADKTVKVGSIPLPTQPTKTVVEVPYGQWEFEGWVDDRGTEVNETYDRVVEKDDNKITFTGNWNFDAKNAVAKYSFVSKQGSPALPSEITKLLPSDENLFYGDELTPSDPGQKEVVVADGRWTFEGYAQHPNTITSDEYTFVGTWAFVANSPTVKEKVTVNFDSAGGSPVESVEIGKGEAVAAPAEPTREGYTFAGWTKDGVKYDFKSVVNENITLLATWDKKTDTERPGKPLDPAKPVNPGETNESNSSLTPVVPSKPTDTSKPVEVEIEKQNTQKGRVELIKKPVLADTGIHGFAYSTIAISILFFAGVFAVRMRKKEN